MKTVCLEYRSGKRGEQTNALFLEMCQLLTRYVDYNVPN